MSEEELGLLGSEMGFPWEEENQTNIWVNNDLSNNSSPILSGGAGTAIPEEEEEGEEKSEDKEIMKSSSNGMKANKGQEIGAVQGNDNKKRSQGGVHKKIINRKSGTATIPNDDQNMKEGSNKKDVENCGGGESDHEIHIWTERERRKKMRNMFANLHALLPQLPPKVDKSTIIDEAVNHIRALEQTLQKLQKQKLEKLQIASTSSTTSTSFNYEATIISEQKVAYHDTREAFLADQVSSNDLVNIVGNNNINPLNNSLSVVSQSSVLFQTWTSPNVVLNICGEQANINICSPKKPGLLTSICYVLEKYKITLVSAQVSADGQRNMYMIQAQYNARTGAPDQFLVGLDPVEEVFKRAVGEILLWVSS